MGLSLYNVDHSSVGYYGCFDDTIDSQQVLKEIDKELNNTNHISYIYIYVNGEVQTYYQFYISIYCLWLLYVVISYIILGTILFAPVMEFVVPKRPTNLLIECKPTTPDIKVTLTMVRIWIVKIYKFREHKIQNKYITGKKRCTFWR